MILKLIISCTETHTFEDLKLVKKQIKSQIRRETKNAGSKALDNNNPKKAWQYIKAATFTLKKPSEANQDLNMLNTFLPARSVLRIIRNCKLSVRIGSYQCSLSRM